MNSPHYDLSCILEEKPSLGQAGLQGTTGDNLGAGFFVRDDPLAVCRAGMPGLFLWLRRLLQHRYFYPLLLGDFDGLLVTSVSVASNSNSGVVGEHPVQTLLCLLSPVGDDHLPGVD